MSYTAGLLDFVIVTNRIRPFIMVILNERTTYESSLYSNSGVFGNCEDFTSYYPLRIHGQNIPAIAGKDSHGISACIMGGYGALKIAMDYPDIFSTVYTLSSWYIDNCNGIWPKQ